MIQNLTKYFTIFMALTVFCFAGEKKKVLFVTGYPGHGHGSHEYKAGSMLLARELNRSGLDIEATVTWYGWPRDEKLLQEADVLVIYGDKGGPLGLPSEKLELVNQRVKEGMGILFIHFGLHPTKEIGEKYFKPWIGGFFETKNPSVNPLWFADLTPDKAHPTSRGLPESFLMFDEFYCHINLAKEDKQVKPTVTATPTLKNLGMRNGIWTMHAEKTLGQEQALFWVKEPEDKKQGRGAGFVGGDLHINWANTHFRRMVLNTITWLTKTEVPKGGVKVSDITEETINQGLDNKTTPANRLSLSRDLKKILEKKEPLKPWDGSPRTWGHTPFYAAMSKIHFFDPEGTVWAYESKTFKKSKGKKKILLIAGRPGLHPGEGEYKSVALMLEKTLNQYEGFDAEAYWYSTPQNVSTLEDADVIVLIGEGRVFNSDQGGFARLLDDKIKQGTRVLAIHNNLHPFKRSVERDKKYLKQWYGVTKGLEYGDGKVKTNYGAHSDEALLRGVEPFALTVRTIKPTISLKENTKTVVSGGASRGAKRLPLLWKHEEGGTKNIAITAGYYLDQWKNPQMQRLVLNSIFYLSDEKLEKVDGLMKVNDASMLEKNLNHGVATPK